MNDLQHKCIQKFSLLMNLYTCSLDENGQIAFAADDTLALNK